MNGQNLTTFCIHIIIDKIYVGIVNRHFFCKFATDIRSLIDVRIQFLFNILGTRIDVYETLCPQQMLVHKGGKIKNWGGECTPTKSLSQNIRVDVNREVKFL